MSNDDSKPPPSERPSSPAHGEASEAAPAPLPTLESVSDESRSAELGVRGFSDSDRPETPTVAADTADTANAGEDFRPEDESERDEAISDAPEPSDWRRVVPLALAILTPLAFFFVLPPLTKSGLWDPYELNVADLARRLALNLHGATSLALDGADNSLPHLNDLGRPQLPFTSIALGFKLFGLHEWAGRAPLATWGLLGVLATYAFVARLVDKRAGLYSAVALTTMPLYFVQARTMLGDVVTMSAMAMAFGGLTVAAFDRDAAGPTPAARRLPWVVMAVVGLAAGFASRGAIVGVAVPTLAVALSRGLVWAAASGERGEQDTHESDSFGDGVAALCSIVGVFALVRGLNDFATDDHINLSVWVGAIVKTQPKYPTFDYFIGHLGPALAPWSAFVPFAMGRMFISPIGRPPSAHLRESTARMAILVGAAVAFTAHGWLASRTDLIAFSAPAILAAACGIAIRDFERGAHASVAVGVGTGVLLGLFHHDFHELPEKAYQAFAVVGATFPDSFKDHALLLWTAALVGFAGLTFLTWVERSSARAPFDPKQYLAILHALRTAWDGLLALAYFALVAGASLAGLVIWVGVKTHAKWLPALSLQIRDGVLNAWWVTAFVPLALVFGTFYACDVWLWAFGRAKPLSSASLTRGFEPFEALYSDIRSEGDGPSRLAALGILVPLMVLAVPLGVAGALIQQGTRWPIALALGIPSGVAVFLALGLLGDLLKGRRAVFMVVSGALVGFILCFSYFPALANQLSPKEVFESYQKVHKSSEPLALFGVGGRTAAYYAGGQPMQLHDTTSAYQWLVSGESGRRYLAMKADELAKLNEMYREHWSPRQNLPVLDARSSQILLVASSLEGDETNKSPLGKMILSAPPKPQRKLDVNMEDKLLVLGYDVTDTSGKLVDVIAPGRAYRMRTYYKVLAPVTTEWEAFIHIDGYHRRHNGDHKPMEGTYPFGLWLKDDLLVDDYEFGLEPNFSPGSYTIFFGLFVGETRLKVKSGPSDGDNRINGGQVRVQ